MDAAKDMPVTRKFCKVVNVFYIGQITEGEFAVPPFFKKNLKNEIYQDGTVVRFQCSVGGFPFPEIEWFKGQDRICEAQHDPLDEFIGYKYYATNDNGNLILVIANILPDDMGPYTCKIRNKIGEARCTAMLFAKTLSNCKAREFSGTGRKRSTDRKKMIIKETITIFGKKGEAFSQNITHLSKPDNGGEAIKENWEDENQIADQGQKVTVNFATPNNCRTKIITVETSTKAIDYEGKQWTDGMFSKSNVDGGHESLDEKTTAYTQRYTGSEQIPLSADETLSEADMTESEIENRVMWIRRGENSNSDFRRDSFPCPLPTCLQEYAGEGTTSPVESLRQSRISSSSQDTNGQHRSKDSGLLSSKIDGDDETGVSDDESRSGISRQFSILSDLSAASVFFTPSQEDCQGSSTLSHSSEKSAYLDVFYDESKRASGGSVICQDRVGTELEVFSDNGETYSDISPLSPDCVPIATLDSPSDPLWSDRSQDEKVSDDLSEVRRSQTDTAALHKTSGDIAQGTSDSETRHLEVDENTETFDSLATNETVIELSTYGTAMMELDELIEKLLQFSKDTDVYVSSLKIGHYSKNCGSIQNLGFSNKSNDEKQEAETASTLSSGLDCMTDSHGDQIEEASKKIPMDGHTPEFIIPLQDVEVDTEEDIVLNVSVTGCPAPRINWFRDDERLDEEESGIITDNLSLRTAQYTCVATNEWGECRSTAKLTVKSSSKTAHQGQNAEESGERPACDEVKMREKRPNQSPTRRRSQIVSASLVDYLRAKAITIQQERILQKIRFFDTQTSSKTKRDSPKACDHIPLRNLAKTDSAEALAREDITIRRGSIISLDSLTTTSYVSADENLTSSDTTVWEEVLSTGDEDFMSTDEMAGHIHSDDELFLPRPVTPTPGSEPPVIYTVGTDLNPFTVVPTSAQTMSEEIKTASYTDFTTRDEDINPLIGRAESQAPKFLTTSEDKTVVAGATCVLTFSISGYPPPQTAWYRNGIRVQYHSQGGPTSPRSILTPTSSSESKTYSVPPRFEIQSQQHAAGLNGEAEYAIHTLTISDARVTDSGEYTVTAMNVYGSIVTAVQVLVKELEDVLQDPKVQSEPVFLSLPSDSDGMLGEEANMTFRVFGIPEPQVTVLHKKEAVAREKFVVSKLHDGRYSIIIRDLQLEDEGEVRIRAYNDIGCSECSAELFVDERNTTPTPEKYMISQWSDHCDMDFDDRQQLNTQIIAPYFDEITEDVITTRGSTASFAVRAYAWPAPEICWYKDGQILEEGPRVRFDSTDFGSHTLKLHEVNEDDAGVYTCVVKNKKGSESCKAELIIAGDLYSSSPNQGRKSETVGRRIKDNYLIKKDIGCGAYALVRLAQSKTDNEHYAAKYIKYTSQETRENFLSEIRILSMLSHENIISYHDCFETKKHIVAILECMEKEWLEFFLERDNVYECEIAFHSRQICEGLSYLHDKKIVHLDMKPENLLVSKDGKVTKIADFGSAQLLQDGQDVLWDYGNPEFVSPEVVSASAVSTASDMWSLGVVIYVAISGISPFVGESDYATILNVLTGKWSFDKRWFTSLSEMSRNFIMQLLILEPKNRMTSSQSVTHSWLQSTSSDAKKSTDPLPEGRLKYFLSRRKWQRTLVTPKSSLVIRPISSLLRREYDSTSVAVSRTAMSDYISSSTVTESEDEIDEVISSEASSVARARAAKLKQTASIVGYDEYDDQRDSLYIENWVDEQSDLEVRTPHVTVTESTPRSSPNSTRKEISSETFTEEVFEEADKANNTQNIEKQTPSLSEDIETEASRAQLTSDQWTELSPRSQRKLKDKKVSFEDQVIESVSENEKSKTAACEEDRHEENVPFNDKPPTKDVLIGKEVQISPVTLPREREISKSRLPVVNLTKASSLDRPHSVSKLLKEDKRTHKVKRGPDNEGMSSKDKIKKKLSSITSKRQRSLDILLSSSSSEDEEIEKKKHKESLTPTRSKFSFFSRRKKPLVKGRSLDLPSKVTEPEQPKPHASPVEESKVHPIRGILKRGGSSEAGSHNNTNIQQKSQNTRSLQATESTFADTRYKRKPLSKGMSLDLDMVVEGSVIESSLGEPRTRPSQTAAERRHQQMRRGSSAESALPSTTRRHPRVSGLRGPLMDQGAEEPMAGMALRRSMNGSNGKSTHTRSFSATVPLSIGSPDYKKSNSPNLSPSNPVSAPPQRCNPLSRGNFFSQSIDIGGSAIPPDMYPAVNNLNERKTRSLQFPTNSRSIIRSSFERPLRSQRISERRQVDGYAPCLTSCLLDQGVTRDQTCVTFVCTIDALPTPEVVWHKGEDVLNSSDKYDLITEVSLNKYQLKIRNLDLSEDLGLYSCEAGNKFGVAKTSCVLKLAVIPDKPSAPELAGNDGNSVWVTWNPPNNCTPTPISYLLQYREMAAMKWVLVHGEIKDTLYKIGNLRPTTSYRFRVRATNNAGRGPFSKVSQRIQIDSRERTEPLHYNF